MSSNSPTPFDLAHSAIVNGNIEAFHAQLEHITDINQSDKQHFTLILIAAFYGRASIIPTLLSKGARLNSALSNGETPVFLAAEKGHHEVLQILVNSGAKLNTTRISDGVTPVLIAASRDHWQALQVLAENQANLDTARPSDNLTPARVAASLGHHKALQVLAKKGANLETAGTDGMTPVSMAIREGHDQALQVLIDNKANLNKTRTDSVKSVCIAASKGHHKIVRILADNRVDLIMPLRFALKNKLKNTSAAIQKVLIEQFRRQFLEPIISKQNKRFKDHPEALHESQEMVQQFEAAAKTFYESPTKKAFGRFKAVQNSCKEALKALDEKTDLITALRFALQKGQVKTAETYQEMLFQQFQTLLKPLRDKQSQRLTDYEKASNEANAIINELEDAAKQFYESPTKDALKEFETACNDVFADDNTTAIREHRAIFGEVFAAIKNFFVALKKVIGGEDRANIRFFDKRTDSATIVDNLKLSIEDVNDNLNNTPM